MYDFRFFLIILVYPFVILNNIFGSFQVAFTWKDPVFSILFTDNIFILSIIWLILWILIFFLVYKYFVKNVAKLIEKIISKFRKK